MEVSEKIINNISGIDIHSIKFTNKNNYSLNFISEITKFIPFIFINDIPDNSKLSPFEYIIAPFPSGGILITDNLVGTLQINCPFFEEKLSAFSI